MDIETKPGFVIRQLGEIEVNGQDGSRPAMSEIEQRLRGENPEHCVVTDRLRANIGMPDTFQFDRDDAVELDELILEAADELARLEADNASLRSKLEEAEGARDRLAKTIAAGKGTGRHIACFILKGGKADA